jgi:hypothetical protein
LSSGCGAAGNEPFTRTVKQLGSSTEETTVANVQRHRWGETNPAKCPTTASLLIEIGDLLYLDTTTHTAKPAAALALGANLAADQVAFAAVFLGVSNQCKALADTSTNPIVYGTDGVYEFSLRTALGADKDIGTLFGIDRNAGGTALLSQSVIEVATANLAIGRLEEKALTGATKVKIRIKSARHEGGPQAIGG